MKKIISLVLCLILGSFALSGCSGADTEPFQAKSYTADAQTDEISIAARDRELEVALSEDEQIHIEYFENSREFYEISVYDGHVLSMVGANDKEWKDYVGGKSPEENRKIRLLVPDALLSKLSLSTTNEDISLAALSVKEDIALCSNGGNISFEELDAGSSIVLSAKNGDITGAVSGGYDDYEISSEIKKGESNLPASKSGGEKVLNAACNNGDINIDFHR